jgi:flagellar L-ring protein precursor FlgH
MRTTSSIQRALTPRCLIVILALLLSTSILPAAGANPKDKKPKSDLTQAATQDYLNRVRAMNVEQQRTIGSLWSPGAPLANAAADYKAHRTGDLVIIRVVDNFSATTNGSAQAQRTFNASSGVSGFFGNLSAANGWQNLFSPTSSQNLAGKGQSALSSTLSLNLAGRVIEALPNGVLVVEAVRDLTVGNDRQTIVLRGLVRPGDIASDNSVPSTAVANLEAEIRGKGVVADATRPPNVAVRILLKILGF